MSNAILQEYQKQLGQAKTTELWNIYKTETRDGLYSKLSRWVLQSEKDLLQNFFHSRQAGGKTFGMKDFVLACKQMEEHLQAGGGIEIINSRLSHISELFEQEAKQVENILNKKEPKNDKIDK